MKVAPSKAHRRSKPLFCALAVLLTGSCSSTTPEGCAAPPQALATAINSALSPLLGALIRYSRNGAEKEGAKPLPAELRKTLKPFFDDTTLARARWTIASDRLALDTVITTVLPRYKAITLGDTIVFRDERSVEHLDVWVHELSHVEQYAKAGGTQDFSRLYLASWDVIELATVRRTNRILDRLNMEARQGLPTWRRACTLVEAAHTG